MKKVVMLIILITIIASLNSNDIARGYSFLEFSKKSDLVALVTVSRKYQHGYLVYVEEVIHSNQEKVPKKIIVWTSTDFHFDYATLVAKWGDKFLLSCNYIDEDSKFENEYISLIEKKGTYYLSSYGVSHLEYKDGKVFGRLIEPFGWVENEEGEEEFIQYEEISMDYGEFKAILHKELNNDVSQE